MGIASTHVSRRGRTAGRALGWSAVGVAALVGLAIIVAMGAAGLLHSPAPEPILTAPFRW